MRYEAQRPRERRSCWACVLPETNSNARLLQPSQSSLQPRTFPPRRNYCPRCRPSGRAPPYAPAFPLLPDEETAMSTRCRRKGKRNVSFFSLFTFFSFPYAMERGGYAMDTRRPIAARETKRLTTECGATLDKSWAARRQGTPAAQPVRWRRAPAALQNLPQRAQRVANPPPPSPRPTATRTRRAALYISAAYRKYR